MCLSCNLILKQFLFLQIPGVNSLAEMHSGSFSDVERAHLCTKDLSSDTL